MTATVNETVLPEGYTQDDVDEIHGFIDNLSDEMVRTIISFLADDVDHLLPLPEEVNDDPKVALKAVANVRPDAVDLAANYTDLAFTLVAMFANF